MSLNTTPSANRIQIGFFGCRNAGKSSLVNSITDQEMAVVSDTKGTTTDPVIKSMELLPLGPVVIIDTPGYDDEGELGEKRIKRTKEILSRTDIAVLVVDSMAGLNSFDNELITIFKESNIPYIIAYNKVDLNEKTDDLKNNEIYVSAKTGRGIEQIKEMLGRFANKDPETQFVGDLVARGDIVILVVPIDEAAPKGRIILPQQMAIRDILDSGAISVVTKETELKETLKAIPDPKLVICDSQVFEQVAKETPDNIPLTSFSILMARYKGFLDQAVEGVMAIEGLKDGDKILIAEGCTHHRQCQDIGTVKIPNWLKKHTGKDIIIETASGHGFPENLTEYSLIIHCGGCMLNEREVKSRMQRAAEAGVPITNYGTAIAYMKGILMRSIDGIRK